MELGLELANKCVAVCLSSIIALTTLGNSLLILLILTQPSLSTTSNYFLVSLFVSDLLVGLVVMPPAMLNHLYGSWLFGGGFCAVWSSCDVMCCSASILNLCLISLDRYLLITSPLQYKLRMTSPKAVSLILATWTLAALASFLPIHMGWHEVGMEMQAPNANSTPIISSSIISSTSSSIISPSPPSSSSSSVGLAGDVQCRLLVSLPYALVASSLTFFLPSAAISFTYCRILRAARKQVRQVASLTANASSRHPLQAHATSNSSGGNSEHRKLANRQSKKALKASLTLGVLLGMFFVTWLPFFVANVTQAMCECVPDQLFDVLTWLGYCNSTMNPVIYPIFMRDFKQAIAKYLRCCGRWREGRPSIASLSMRHPQRAARRPQTLRRDPDSQLHHHILIPEPRGSGVTRAELAASGNQPPGGHSAPGPRPCKVL